MRIALLTVLSLTTACSTTAESPPHRDIHLSEAAPSSPGLAFARANCAACHAVETGSSPKPEAPTFAAVINTPGLTADTLQPWLRNSHNFPGVMNFAIGAEQIDDLAAYMLTLKDPAYRPPIR